MKLSISVPTDLLIQAQSFHPDWKVSLIFQEALKAYIKQEWKAIYVSPEESISFT